MSSTDSSSNSVPCISTCMCKCICMRICMCICMCMCMCMCVCVCVCTCLCLCLCMSVSIEGATCEAHASKVRPRLCRLLGPHGLLGPERSAVTVEPWQRFVRTALHQLKPAVRRRQRRQLVALRAQKVVVASRAPRATADPVDAPASSTRDRLWLALNLPQSARFPLCRQRLRDGDC